VRARRLGLGLLARWSGALIPPGVVAASAVLVSAAFGAGTAFLVVGPGEAEDLAKGGRGGRVQSSSAAFPIAATASSGDRIQVAQRAGSEGPPAGDSGSVSTASSRAEPSGAEDALLAAGTGSAPEPAGKAEPSQSEHGGASQPPAGPSAGAPEAEEPSEEVPAEEGEGEGEEGEEAPPEEPQENEEKVTVCHKAGSTGAKTLTVGASAAEEHLAHGDTLGACG
jgi:hypothetical protein